MPDGGMNLALASGERGSIDATASTASGTQVLSLNQAAITSTSGAAAGALHAAADASAAGGYAEVDINDARVALSGSTSRVDSVIAASAHASGGGSAQLVFGGVDASASGADAHALATIDASTPSDGSSTYAGVSGDLAVNAQGTASADARLGVNAAGEAFVSLDGHTHVAATAPSATVAVQLAAEGAGASVHVNSLELDLEGGSGSRAWLDLYADHANGLSVGSLSVHAAAGTQAVIDVQHDSSAGGSLVDPSFVTHGGSSAALQLGSASLSGAGDITLNLDVMGFPSIAQDPSLGSLHLQYQLAERSDALSNAPLTTFTGFTAAHDTVMFDGQAASAANFADAGAFTTLASLDSGLNAALDGTHKYVFALYTGSEDLNRDGIANDQNSGVLAMDNDGAGITAVLVLPGTTTLTPTDLA